MEKNKFASISTILIGLTLFTIIMGYFNFYSKKVIELKKNTQVLYDLKLKEEKYKTVDKYIQRLEKQKENVLLMISYFDKKKATSEKIQDFLKEIGMIGKESNVSINSLESRENNAWAISWVSNYKYMLTFLFKIENIFNIRNMQITGGKESANEQIAISIYSPYDSNNSTSQSTIFDLPDKIDLIIGELTDLNNKILGLQNFKIRSNPMYFKDTILRPSLVNIMPNLEVNGIIWDNIKSLVIINDKVYKIGDIINGAQIIDITRVDVTLLWYSKRIVIKPIRKD